MGHWRSFGGTRENKWEEVGVKFSTFLFFFFYKIFLETLSEAIDENKIVLKQEIA